MGTNLRNLEVFHHHSHPGNKSTRKLTVKCFFKIYLIIFLTDAKLHQLHKVKLDFRFFKFPKLKYSKVSEEQIHYFRKIN